MRIQRYSVVSGPYVGEPERGDPFRPPLRLSGWAIVDGVDAPQRAFGQTRQLRDREDRRPSTGELPTDRGLWYEIYGGGADGLEPRPLWGERAARIFTSARPADDPLRWLPKQSWALSELIAGDLVAWLSATPGSAGRFFLRV